MQLTFINGSPRGIKSNTAALMDHFIRGFGETAGNTCRVEYLARHAKDPGVPVDSFAGSDNVIIGFPLYVDAMPGSVKAFLEALSPLKGREGNPSLGFVIQCGFPETHHIRFVERYVEKFARRMACPYLGTIAKGGCEGLKIQPPFLTQKYYDLFHMTGKIFGETGKLDDTLLRKLARPETLNDENLKQVIPFVNGALWDSQMKENGVLDRSFDRPYE